MREREPTRETVGQGELFFLRHPGSDHVFSGYGLTMRPGSNEFLVGLLMVDRPYPVDPDWLREVRAAFGGYQLIPMTTTGERVLCQMQIEPESRQYLGRFPTDQSTSIQAALDSLPEHPPNPTFALHWDEKRELWASRFVTSMEMPVELRQVFERTGYGCAASETNIGIVHVCHAADVDIEGFAEKPVQYQWQLIKMPSAPLIRFEATIFDQPHNPFRFESFLNLAEEDQARILAQLASQDKLYLAFYGDDFTYRHTRVIHHSEEQWQHLDELVTQADAHWQALPPEYRDYDRAKAAFMSRFP